MNNINPTSQRNKTEYQKMKKLLKKLTFALASIAITTNAFGQITPQANDERLISIAKQYVHNQHLNNWYEPETISLLDGTTPSNFDFTYNEIGKIATISTIVSEEGVQMELLMTFTYNSANLVDNILVQTIIASTPINLSKSVFTYNASNLVQTEMNYTYAVTQWIETQKSEYQYDEENYLTSVITQNNINGWTNDSKVDYTYEYGLLIIETEYEWGENTWVYEVNHVYEYDFLDRVISITNQEWSNNFQNTEKFVYSYNSDGLLTDIIEQEWEASSNVWNNDDQAVFTYDANNNCIGSTCNEWNGSSWVSNPSESVDITFFYNDMASSMEFENVSTMTVTYTTVNHLGIENNDVNFDIFPNPANNYFKVECEEDINSIEVFNVTGQLITKQSSTTINTADYESGMYLVKVILENGSSISKKIMVQ